LRGGTYLREISCHNGTVGKFAASQSPQGLGGRLRSIKLDEDLADACRLSATSTWSWNLDIHDLAILLTLLPDVFEDF
jgi:hypothetical protein